MLKIKFKEFFRGSFLVFSAVAIISLGIFTLALATSTTTIGSYISTAGSVTAGSLILGTNTEDVLGISVASSSTISDLYWGDKKINNPMNTLGDIIYGGASGLITRLTGSASTTKMFLSQTGDGSNSAIPSWSTINYSNLIGEDTTAQYKSINEAIINRTHDEIVVVTTTIQAAIDNISDHAYNKRYLVYVPNGTYSEEIIMKSYVDVIGQSKSGVILQSSSGSSDTVTAGGKQILLANMTINHTFNIGDDGVYQYPIHLDSSSDGKTPLSNSDTILFNLAVNSYGTNAKSGIGIGMTYKQRIYLLNCDFYSTTNAGIFAHNTDSQASSMQLYIINTNASSDSYDAFYWNNLGSGQDDLIAIYGGTFSSADSGSVYDIKVTNDPNYSGDGEAFISIDDNVIFDTIDLVDLTERLSLPISIVAIPNPPQPKYSEYRGTVFTGPLGLSLSNDGIITTFRADRRLYLRDSAEYMGYFENDKFLPSTDTYKIGLSSAGTTHISSIESGGKYMRFTTDNTIVAQFSSMNGAQFYEPLKLSSNAYISQTSGLANSLNGATTFSATTTFSTDAVMSNAYLQIDDNAGIPDAGDCDNDSEVGRMVVDTTNERLYICNGATRGWDYTALTD